MAFSYSLLTPDVTAAVQFQCSLTIFQGVAVTLNPKVSYIVVSSASYWGGFILNCCFSVNLVSNLYRVAFISNDARHVLEVWKLEPIN